MVPPNFWMAREGRCLMHHFSSSKFVDSLLQAFGAASGDFEGEDSQNKWCLQLLGPYPRIGQPTCWPLAARPWLALLKFVIKSKLLLLVPHRSIHREMRCWGKKWRLYPPKPTNCRRWWSNGLKNSLAWLGCLCLLWNKEGKVRQ